MQVQTVGALSDTLRPFAAAAPAHPTHSEWVLSVANPNLKVGQPACSTISHTRACSSSATPLIGNSFQFVGQAPDGFVQHGHTLQSTGRCAVSSVALAITHHLSRCKRSTKCTSNSCANAKLRWLSFRWGWLDDMPECMPPMLHQSRHYTRVRLVYCTNPPGMVHCCFAPCHSICLSNAEPFPAHPSASRYRSPLDAVVLLPAGFSSRRRRHLILPTHRRRFPAYPSIKYTLLRMFHVSLDYAPTLSVACVKITDTEMT